mmetsp:Transcript_86033/g.216574  ORF Transcript_86033/g.216574 Transcript_86033/m.216574 type:complete len:593 (+) Transcript_86033:132-1910(+)
MAAEEGRAQPAYDERQALEVAMAQVEIRLRGAITELIQPTIQRTTLVVADLEQIKNQVSQHTRGLQEVQLGQFKVMEQMSTIASFKEEMSRWDVQRRTHEATIDEKTEAMQQKMEAYRYSLEQKESALHHLHRSVDRMATELNHAMEEQENQKELFEGRIDAESRKINQVRSEIEIRLASMELKHNALTDELWGEETGLAKVAGELKKTNAVFGHLEASVQALQDGKAEAAQLDKLRAEVGKMVHEANTAVSAMRQSVGNVVNDVREHFRTASQTISAHNATFIGEVREQYQQELASAAKLRDEVQDFMAQVATRIDGLDARVAGAAAKADALAAEAREEVEELNRRRKSDKSSADNELKALKKRLSGVFENSDTVLRGIEHIYSIVRAMLDSDLIQCSLEMQDSIDRKKIALLGVKDDETSLSRTYMQEPQRPRPECRTKAQVGYPRHGAHKGGAAEGGAKSKDPVVRVDNRCLSCSGQAPLVLSAFKMACLQYSPSPVEHGGSQYDRGDLLFQRHSLLEGAHSALLEGPASTSSAADLPGGVAAGESSSGPLSAYAAVEARHQHGPRSTSGNSSALRLPSLTPSGALTVR